jgi:hypothetical protein
MSVIYYCDASGCVSKSAGRATEKGHVPPDGWSSFVQGIEMMDACSPQHQEEIIAANTPEEEPEEEAEAEAEDS